MNANSPAISLVHKSSCSSCLAGTSAGMPLIQPERDPAQLLSRLWPLLRSTISATTARPLDRGICRSVARLPESAQAARFPLPSCPPGPVPPALRGITPDTRPATGLEDELGFVQGGGQPALHFRDRETLAQDQLSQYQDIISAQDSRSACQYRCNTTYRACGWI